MPEITTAPNVIPQDFVPRLAADLLTVPDKTYLFARWAMAAMRQAEAREALGPQFDVLAAQLRAGAPLDRGELANIGQAMSQGMGGPLDVSNNVVFPDLITFRSEAKGPGDTILINRPKFLTSPTTIANRLISTTKTFFGGTTQPLQMDQVSVSIRNTAGPLAADGSAFSPLSISLFGQARMFHDALEMARLVLVQDRVRFLDDNLILLLLACASANSDGTIRGGDVASNTAFTGTNNEPMSFDLLPKASEIMAGRGIPGINGGRKYIFVAHQHQKQQLQNDPAWQRLVSYHETMNPVFPGYVGETNDFIICESNNMPTTTVGAGGAYTGYQGLVLAPGALSWALGMAPRLLRDNNDDGGRFARLGWEAHEGFQANNDKYVLSVLTT